MGIGDPRRRTRDNAKGKRSNGRQPVRVCSNHTSVACAAILRTTDGNRAKRPFGPVAPCGDGTGSRPDRQPKGRSSPAKAGASNPRSRCPPACGARQQASTGRQAEARSEALTPTAPVAGELITGMVINVKAWFRPHNNLPAVPCLTRSHAFLRAPRNSAKAAKPHVQHGKTVGLHWRTKSAPTPQAARSKQNRRHSRAAGPVIPTLNLNSSRQP